MNPREGVVPLVCIDAANQRGREGTNAPRDLRSQVPGSAAETHEWPRQRGRNANEIDAGGRGEKNITTRLPHVTKR